VSRTATAAIAVFGLRVAYGAGLVVAPEKLTRSWLGADVARDPVKVALRGIGGREIVLHGFGIAAAVHGRPLWPWLAISMAGDVSDIAATFAGRAGIPGDSPRKTLAVAGGSAALSMAVLVASTR
jgi:hypothetical protein